MAQKKNLSDQLNESNADDESLRGINFAIQKNVMIWGGTILQLSNISSISRYNRWENQEEGYFEKVEKSVGVKELRDANPFFKLAFWGALICFIISLFKSFFWILFLGCIIYVGYFYLTHRKTTIDAPRTRTNRKCHYMMCVRMNSTKKYDFEIETEEFRNKVMVALYQRIVDPGQANGIQVDLKNCVIMPPNSVINAGQILLGDENENNIEYSNEAEQ